MLGYIFISIVGLYILKHAVYLFAAGLNRETFPVPEPLPKISVLVAARNEEKNIGECLRHLHALDYPQDKISIHIGDDASEDRTAEVIKLFAADKPSFHYHRISDTLPGLRGKQNVLAQLFKPAQAEGSDYMLITDADIRVKPSWAKGMVAGFSDERTGMVSAPTCAEGKGLFSVVQFFEWLMFSFTDYVLTRLGMPVSGIGNNMAVSRRAYESTGGYENIPFSITEDYQLFRYMVLSGKWKFRFLFSLPVINLTRPAENFRGYFHQRRRWILGGLHLPYYNFLLLGLDVLCVPALIGSYFLLPPGICNFMLCIKCAADFFMIATALRRAGQMNRLLYFPVYELYFNILMILSPLLAFLPVSVIWKGRTY